MSTEEDFDGCQRQCRKQGKHTYLYGSCEFGERPKPTLDLFLIEDGEDGYPMGFQVNIDASVFLPWLENLPVDEQHKILERVARAAPNKRRAILEQERNSWTDEH